MKTKTEVALELLISPQVTLDNTGSFENLKLSVFFFVISFVHMQITDRFWNHYDNSLQFQDKLSGSIK